MSKRLSEQLLYLNKGELWTSIFQEYFIVYLSKCCFRNHLPSCRAEKQQQRDATIYLLSLPRWWGMHFMLSFCCVWTTTYLQHICWSSVRTWGVTKFSFFFLLFPAAKIKWKKLEVYLIISWYNLHHLNLSLYYQIMNEKSWQQRENMHSAEMCPEEAEIDARCRKNANTWRRNSVSNLWFHTEFIKWVLSRQDLWGASRVISFLQLLCTK